MKARSIGIKLAVVAFYVGSNVQIIGAQIVPGVTQSAAHTANITGAVTASDGTPVAGADVRLSGPALLTTKSDNHGAFNFTSVPWGIYQIDVMSALGTASRKNVSVNGDISIAVQYQARIGLATIAHVSTAGAGAHINVTSASIASVTPSDYAFQGNASWQGLLDKVPGVTVGGNIDGGQALGVVIPGAPIMPITLSINGALPYETSMTLDGMPLQNTSYDASGSVGGGFDLSALPMTAFDTADVVRGPGANAPSIFDSIGGSFVLHAPGEVASNVLELSTSNDSYGGIVADVKAAWRLGRLSATVVYGISDSPGPLGRRTVVSANPYTPVTINGRSFLGCAPVGCTDYPSNLGSSTYPNCYCAYQNALLLGGVPINTSWTQHNGAVALSYEITPSVTGEVFYAGSSSRMEAPYPEYSVDFTPVSSYTGSIRPGFYALPEVDGPLSVSQASSLLEEKLTAYIGRAVLRLAAVQDNSFQQQIVPDNLPNGQYTVWGTGYYSSAPSTLVNFNGTSAALTFSPFLDSADTWVNNRDVLLSYATQVGRASSAGVSYVTSYYNDPGEFRLVCCTFVNSASSQSSAISETTSEVRIYADTELTDRLSLNGSWYFAAGAYHVMNPANPSIWADSVFPYNAPRLSAVWRVSSDVAVRAAAGGGFALPQLSYLVGTNYIFCTYICSQSLTNLNLQPERAFGFDVGTDVRFHRDTILSFDLYRTNLYGQFFQSTNLTGTFSGLPLYTTTFENLAQSRFEGMNMDLTHDVIRGVYWHGSLGLTRGYVVGVPAGFYDNPTIPCVNCSNTYIVPGINFNGEFQSTVPYATATGQIGYRWASVRYVDLSSTYYGNNNAYFQPAFVELDAHAGYALTNNIALLVTVKNISGVHDQEYQYLTPSLGAPTIAGSPYPLFGIPYGPRSLIVTANFKY